MFTAYFRFLDNHDAVWQSCVPGSPRNGPYGRIALAASTRGSGRFSAAVAADIMLTVVSKLLFYADGGNQELNILSPSGHASLAVTFYGCAAIILASKRHLLQRVVIIGGAVLVVVFISISRIALQMTPPKKCFLAPSWADYAWPGFAAGAKRLDKLRLHLPVPVLFVADRNCVTLGDRTSVQRRTSHWSLGDRTRFALGIS